MSPKEQENRPKGPIIRIGIPVNPRQRITRDPGEIGPDLDEIMGLGEETGYEAVDEIEGAKKPTKRTPRVEPPSVYFRDPPPEETTVKPQPVPSRRFIESLPPDNGKVHKPPAARRAEITKHDSDNDNRQNVQKDKHGLSSIIMSPDVILDDKIREDLNEQLREELQVLPPRHARVLECRFTLGLTLEDTGHRLGVTRERVRQIEKRAKDELCEVHFHGSPGNRNVPGT